MAKKRVEDCFELSLDQLLKELPDPSSSSWTARITYAQGGEVANHSMVVRRFENRLTLYFGTFGLKHIGLRQRVTIDPRRRGGYREYLVCLGCDRRVRHLFSPRPNGAFLCRTCYNLAYTTQSRHRGLFERLVIKDKYSGRRRVRLDRAYEDPDRSGLTALRAAARSADPKAMDAYAGGAGRPRKNRGQSGRKPGRPKTKRPYKRRIHYKKIVAGDDAYCVKCKESRRIAQPFLTVFSNGRPAIKGTCSVCGTRLSKARAWAN